MRTIHVDTLPEITEPPEGCWVAKVKVWTSLNPHWDDDRFPRNERPLVRQTQRVARVLGAGHPGDVVYSTSVSEDTVQGHYATATIQHLIVRRRPFVIVTHAGNRYEYEAARQLHKGELGVFPAVENPAVLAGWHSDPTAPERNLHWVQVREIARITGLAPDQIFRGFGEFSPSAINDPNVPTLIVAPWSIDDVILRVYTREEPGDNFCRGESQWGGGNAIWLDKADPEQLGDLYVPQPFAYTVIRLSQFGYQPDGSAPKTARLFKAPVPTFPSHALPVLEAEDLQLLYMQLAEELPQDDFRQAALSTFNFPLKSEWQDTPELDDGGSFRYHTNFQLLSHPVESGQVVIGTSFWSRGGHSKGEYYAGFAAVFPADTNVTNARHDPATLRLWFQPGAVMRETPEGSRDGLIPPQVPADAAELVERLLLNLGYDY
jgi:hypothetical protein